MRIGVPVSARSPSRVSSEVSVVEVVLDVVRVTVEELELAEVVRFCRIAVAEVVSEDVPVPVVVSAGAEVEELVAVVVADAVSVLLEVLDSVFDVVVVSLVVEVSCITSAR